jgi:hypothetical protein
MTPEPAASSNDVTRQDVYSLLGALGAIITVVAAVMFYFGWRRSDAQARSMSIDVSLFGFSSQDYVLRSISSLYVPLLVILGLLLLWVWCHVALTQRLSPGWLNQNSRRSALARSARAVMLAGIVLAAASLIFSALAGRESAPWPVDPLAEVLAPREWIVPLVLAVGTLVAAYAAWLRRQLVGQRRQGTSRLSTAVLPPILVVAMVALAGFWLLEEYAAAVGRDYAEDLAAGVDRLPRAVVTSATPLGLQAPGVVEQPIPGAGGTERYRTTGLRFLARSGGKVLLVHDAWTPATGTVIVLADTDALAWEFFR